MAERQRYYCTNYACPSRNSCARFLTVEMPIKYVMERSNSYLFPFKSGIQTTFFTPTVAGMCKSFIDASTKEYTKEKKRVPKPVKQVVVDKNQGSLF